MDDNIKKSNWIQTSRRLEFLKNMPPLYHSMPNASFDLRKSEVLNWILNSPEIFEVLEYVFRIVNGTDKRRERLLVYDSESMKWFGINQKSGSAENRGKNHD